MTSSTMMSEFSGYSLGGVRSRGMPTVVQESGAKVSLDLYFDNSLDLDLAADDVFPASLRPTGSSPSSRPPGCFQSEESYFNQTTTRAGGYFNSEDSHFGQTSTRASGVSSNQSVSWLEDGDLLDMPTNIDRHRFRRPTTAGPPPGQFFRGSGPPGQFFTSPNALAQATVSAPPSWQPGGYASSLAPPGLAGEQNPLHSPVGSHSLSSSWAGGQGVQRPRDVRQQQAGPYLHLPGAAAPESDGSWSRSDLGAASWSLQGTRHGMYDEDISAKSMAVSSYRRAPDLLDRGTHDVPPPPSGFPSFGTRSPAEDIVLDDAYISQGSVGHPHRCSAPCKYALKSRGCKDGVDCTHCHLCTWRRKGRKDGLTASDDMMTVSL
mmetsp:Transcript_30794/g.55090  ORF Transcript_30794/g.55090 Transcript_30794/m.55090 type:complete len:377 (+) Transcript_30794:73-1203(+)